MSEFKLIGIIPLENCHERFLKNLEIGEKYLFYQDYEIKISEEKNQIESFERSKDSKDIEGFYETFYGNSINISAIVGKNGCGKSTLIELLFYIIYKISLDKNYIDYTDNIQRYRLKELEELSSIHTNFLLFKEHLIKQGLESNGYKSMVGYYFDLIRKLKLDDSLRLTHSSINSTQETRQILNIIANTINQKTKKLKDRINEEEIFHETLDKLNVSILFSRDKSLYELKINYGDSSVKNWTNPEADFLNIAKINFIELFYSIAINYSHHSLNSRLSGTWLDALFHKNDGYKTPLVINPMRNDGNFSINKEENFARARLLANLVSARLNNIDDRNLLLNEEQNIIGIHFKLKKSIEEKALLSANDMKEGMNIEVFLIRKFILEELNINFEQLEKIPYYKELLDYFVNKWYKILDTYDGYIDIEGPKTAGENPAYVDSVYKYYVKDRSHITFKIRQVINYFKQELKIRDVERWQREEKGHLITPINLIHFCGIKHNDNFNAIQEKLPPAIFKIDFILSDNVSEEEFYLRYDEDSEWIKKQPRFGGLSSGEKQLIHSVQTVIYHLSNIESIDNTDEIRVAYSHVNLIFDEIELYFHPDLQRKFIKYLIDSISRIKLERIKGINVLFSTHSPFILSDIPANNILRLENGLPSNKVFTQTFGANIHDLLANDFFLNNGFMGEFAQSKIQDIIDFINSEEHPGLTKIESAFELVSLIGEPVIKNKLNRLLQEKFPFLGNKNDSLEEKLKIQEEIIERLKKMQPKKDEDNRS